ncbi:hypothetical protein TSUD_82090 [Trifolium subterraneum]|uniref:Replication protein A 70 kDa DNA-binding subunit B/D first OB fold domain-containing protein n=1 Tax=Trifolium subterraneum TaxID=3900 RepID=A0A2Z6NMV0_TRISU|nr:hypothetical protein TSUD_82090 [Trifolium subterraneum]
MAKIGKKFTNLCDISPEKKEGIRIKVRVSRLWKVSAFLNPSETSSIQMVLLDDKGGKIHASIRKQLVYMFDTKIEEGGVYEMSLFDVSPQIGFYRTTLHPYKLNFQIKTKVQASNCSDISLYGLTFTSLEEVCGHLRDYEFLVDVIGIMTGISAESEFVRDGKITKRVVIELTDSSGKCECALFGDYVDDLNKKMGKSHEGLPVVVIQFAKVKIFRDKASIQNDFSATRIFINPDIVEAETFKNGGSAKPPLDEEFLRMHPKKKIGELLDLEEDGIFAVYGSVTGIVGGEKWWYPAYKCYRAVVPDSGAYYCTSCVKHIFQFVPRFKVKIEVSDGDSTAVFILFDFEMSVK